MRITVFKNGYKETDKHPDYIIYKAEEGKDLEKIGALWVGKSTKGNSYMSGNIEIETRGEEPTTPDPDDGIPF